MMLYLIAASIPPVAMLFCLKGKPEHFPAVGALLFAIFTGWAIDGWLQLIFTLVASSLASLCFAGLFIHWIGSRNTKAPQKMSIRETATLAVGFTLQYEVFTLILAGLVLLIKKLL